MEGKVLRTRRSEKGAVVLAFIEMLLNFMRVEKSFRVQILMNAAFNCNAHFAYSRTTNQRKQLNSNTCSKTKQSKLLNISHFQAGTHSAVYEYIMGCPICFASFVPLLPTPAVRRLASFFVA